MERFGLPKSSTTAEFIEAREARTRHALKEVGGAEKAVAGPPLGSAIHFCMFDAQARLRQIRIQPLEQLGGNLMTFDDAVPRFRRGLPLMPEPNSDISQMILNHVANASRVFGTRVDIRDGVGVIELD
jgi:hypothetical protein